MLCACEREERGTLSAAQDGYGEQDDVDMTAGYAQVRDEQQKASSSDSFSTNPFLFFFFFFFFFLLVLLCRQA